MAAAAKISKAKALAAAGRRENCGGWRNSRRCQQAETAAACGEPQA